MREKTEVNVSFLVPLRTRSAPNLREHWGTRATRVARERRATMMAWLTVPMKTRWNVRFGTRMLIVTLTRTAPRVLDDDNLRGCLKAVRDEVAAQLDIDDGDGRVLWAYQQRRGEPKQYAVRVEVRAR
jgi:hypothetical protein